MTNIIKKTAVASKKFVTKHKTPIVVIATVVATTALNRKLTTAQVKTRDTFINDNGLTEEFDKWLVTEEEEI